MTTSLLLPVLVVIIPYTLIWLAGIIIAIVTWRRHPRLSLLVTITLALFFIIQVIGDVISYELPQIMTSLHMTFGTIDTLLTLFGIVTAIPLWALLYWAIFGWRKSVPMAVLPLQPAPWPQQLPPQPQWPPQPFQPPQQVPQQPQSSQPQWPPQPPQQSQSGATPPQN